MTRDEFVEKLKTQIDQWNADITKTEAEMKSASGDMQQRYAEKIAEASRYRAEAQAKLAESLKHSSETWEKRRADMESAWGDIMEGFKKAWARFS